MTAVELQLKDAWKEVRDIRRNAIALRDEFLLSKTTDPANPTHVTKNISRIRCAEETKAITKLFQDANLPFYTAYISRAYDRTELIKQLIWRMLNH